MNLGLWALSKNLCLWTEKFHFSISSSAISLPVVENGLRTYKALEYNPCHSPHPHPDTPARAVSEASISASSPWPVRAVTLHPGL